MSQPVGLGEEAEDRVAHRLGRGQREPARAARRHHVQHAAAVPARHHGHAGHQRLGGHQAEPLALRRKDHEVRLRQVARALRPRRPRRRSCTNGPTPSFSTRRSSAPRSGPSPTMVSGRSWPQEARNGDGLDRQAHPLLRGEPRDDHRPAAAGGPRVVAAVHRHRLHVRGVHEPSGAGLHPAGQLAGDRGHHARALEDRPGEGSRDAGASKQRRVGAVDGEDARRALGEGQAARHPPVGVEEVGARLGFLAGGAPERAPEAGERAEARRAPAAPPAWFRGRPASRLRAEA